MISLDAIKNALSQLGMVGNAAADVFRFKAPQYPPDYKKSAKLTPQEFMKSRIKNAIMLDQMKRTMQ